MSFDEQKARSLGQLLFKAARLYNDLAIARIQAVAPQSRLRNAHTRLFPHLDFQGVRPSTIADRAGISRQATGKLLDELIEEGLVERLPDPIDGRASLVRFTDRGRDALVHGLTILEGLRNDLREHVPVETLERLPGDLTALISGLEKLIDTQISSNSIREP